MASKTFTTKYPGVCCGCRTGIIVGTSARYGYGKALYHAGCVPTGRKGRPSRDDQEYYQGRQEAETVKMVRAIYGEEAAIAEELAQDMRAGDW